MLGNESVKTIYTLSMKKKSGIEQEMIAAHCASGIHLFDLDTYDAPGFLNVQRKKIEVFPCVAGFGYFVPDEGTIFIFYQNQEY